MMLVMATAGAMTLSATQADKDRVPELRLPKEIRVKPRGETRSSGLQRAGTENQLLGGRRADDEHMRVLERPEAGVTLQADLTVR